jgi:tetratricopeptide (TPR) repeat protein
VTIPGSGQVAHHPLGPLVYSLAASQFDGALTLEQEGRRYALWYKGGLVVEAESPAPDDQLGRVLLQAGILTNAQVGESIRRLAQQPNRRQLDILVEMGALAGDLIDRAALMGLVRRALRLFHPANATFTVAAQAHDRRGGGPIDCRWVLYKGVRQHYDEPRLDRELVDLAGLAVKLASGAEPYLESFGFADEERIVVSYLAKGYWELPDLVEACVSLARPMVLAATYALWSAGCLDAQPAATVPRLRKRAREATEQVPRSVLAPPPVARSSYVQAAGVKKELLFDQSPGPQSPGPQSPGPGQAPTPAYSPPPPTAAPRQSQLGPPAKRPSGPGPDPRVLASTTVPGLREQILKKFAAIEAGADHFAVLEIERNAGRDQVKTTYFALAKSYHPDRLALVKLEDLRPQVDRIFARLSEAFAVLGDEGRKREYLDILARGGEAAIKRKEDDEAAQAAKLIGAEEQFRLGEMSLRRQAWPQAVEAFKKALENNPDEPEHHAYYHWSLWCSSTNKDAVLGEVKKGLQRALDLNNRCVPALYFLGQVLNQMGDHDRAYTQFQKVLSYQPRHVDAEREVRLIEMRRKKGKKK